MSNCQHWQDPITVGPHEVWVSGSSYRGTRKGESADLSVYLDLGWVKDIPGDVSTLGTNLGGSPERDILVIKWPDFGVISLEKFQWLVEIISDALLDNKTVEIGCIGGHGRTGTLLAGVISDVEGVSARTAIQAVRDRHCSHAVETKAQQTLIFDALGETPNLLPAPPAKATFSAKSSDGGKSAWLSSPATGTKQWWGSQAPIEEPLDPDWDALISDIDSLDIVSQPYLPIMCPICGEEVGVDCQCTYQVPEEEESNDGIGFRQYPQVDLLQQAKDKKKNKKKAKRS